MKDREPAREGEHAVVPSIIAFALHVFQARHCVRPTSLLLGRRCLQRGPRRSTLPPGQTNRQQHDDVSGCENGRIERLGRVGLPGDGDGGEDAWAERTARM